MKLLYYMHNIFSFKCIWLYMVEIIIDYTQNIPIMDDLSTKAYELLTNCYVNVYTFR